MSILKRSCIEIISFYTHSLGNIRPFKKSQVYVRDSFFFYYYFTLSARFSCLMCFSSKIPFGKCIEIPGNLNTKDMPSFEFRQAKPNREIKFADRLAYYWCRSLMGWRGNRDYDVYGLGWRGIL